MKKGLIAVCIFVLAGCIQQQDVQQGEPIKEGILSTDNGLQLLLNKDDVIERVTIDGGELVDTPSKAFWIKDFTPDYEIDNLITNAGFERDTDKNGIADTWTLYTISGDTIVSNNTHNSIESS